jgi:hypothetical protein
VIRVLLLRDGGDIAERLRAPRLERTIGVIHIDKTRAVEPLERSTGWIRGDVPETFLTFQ